MVIKWSLEIIIPFQWQIFQQAMFDYQSVNQKSTFFEHVDYMFKKCGILMNVVVRND
jgi:hypothetical protein